jgi:hypothetical protein
MARKNYPDEFKRDAVALDRDTEGATITGDLAGVGSLPRSVRLCDAPDYCTPRIIYGVWHSTPGASRNHPRQTWPAQAVGWTEREGLQPGPAAALMITWRIRRDESA